MVILLCLDAIAVDTLCVPPGHSGLLYHALLRKDLICSISAACSAGGWLVYKGMIQSSVWHWVSLDSFMHPHNYLFITIGPQSFFYTLPHPVLAAPYLLSGGLSFSRIAGK